MDAFLNSKFAPIALLVIFIGSLVDIFQFVWLAKRSYRKLKRLIYAKIRKEVLENIRESTPMPQPFEESKDEMERRKKRDLELQDQINQTISKHAKDILQEPTMHEAMQNLRAYEKRKKK